MASSRYPNAFNERVIRQLIQQFTNSLSNKRVCCQFFNRQTYPLYPQDPLFPDYSGSDQQNVPGQNPGSGSGQPGNSGSSGNPGQIPPGQTPPGQIPPGQQPDPPYMGYPVPEGVEWLNQFAGIIYYMVSQIVDAVMTDVMTEGKADLKDLLANLLETFRGGKDEQGLERMLKDCLNGKMPKSDEGNSSINGMQDQMIEKITNYIVLVFMFELVKWSQLWITAEIQHHPQIPIPEGNIRKRRGSHSKSAARRNGRGGILQNIFKGAGVDM